MLAIYEISLYDAQQDVARHQRVCAEDARDAIETLLYQGDLGLREEVVAVRLVPASSRLPALS